jgi:hypothetical protein
MEISITNPKNALHASERHSQDIAITAIRSNKKIIALCRGSFCVWRSNQPALATDIRIERIGPTERTAKGLSLVAGSVP